MLHKFAKNGARVSRKYENGSQNINSGLAVHIVQSSAFEDRASVAVNGQHWLVTGQQETIENSWKMQLT